MTTSPNHTSVKITPGYPSGFVVHVKDASRAVGVCSRLMSPDKKAELINETRTAYDALRTAHADRTARSRFLTIEDARRKSGPPDWSKASITKPSFFGTRVFDDYDLNDLVGVN